LEVQVEVAQERVDYAKNAWANRESLCEADLNRPNCYAYFKADLAAAKTELKYAQTAYKNAGCPLR
jgi:5-bromo-4-chloroindolyl phosphate hydrolysis protein